LKGLTFMALVEWKRIREGANIAEITLNRPEARNAFTTEMAEQILEICRGIDNSDIRAVLITSSTEKLLWC
jgi:enoyl-CoA hydratase